MQKETEFIDLVWTKTSRSHSWSHPMFVPAAAFAAAALVSVYMLWHYDGAVSGTKLGAIIKGETILNGKVLTVRGVDPASQWPKELRLGETALAKETIEEGDRMVTDENTVITFYLPRAGYLSLAEGSSLVVRKARKNVSSGAAAYELFLERGALYSHLDHTENHFLLQCQTPFGHARVTGTDFVLSVEPQLRMMVEVVKGSVEVESFRGAETARNVDTAHRALVSNARGGQVIVGPISDKKAQSLREAFESIFGSYGEKPETEQFPEPNFRVVSQREE